MGGALLCGGAVALHQLHKGLDGARSCDGRPRFLTGALLLGSRQQLGRRTLLDENISITQKCH